MVMKENHFSPRTKEAFHDVLKSLPKGERQYVVSDCDGTLLFGDSQYVLTNDQIEYLNFAFKPEELTDIFKAGNEDKWTIERNGISIPFLLEKIQEDYSYLYKRGYVSKDPKNFLRAASWQKDPIFIDFKIRLHHLLDKIYSLWGYEASAYGVYALFKGFTIEEYKTLSSLSHMRHSKIKGLLQRSYLYPDTNEKVSYLDGLHPIEEMKELLYELERRGIDVYVASASPEETVKDALKLFAFPSSVQVYGIANKIDSQGKITAFKEKQEHASPILYGKVETIEKYMAPLYQGRPPLMVFGDSEGDVAMLTHFKDSNLSLLFDDGSPSKTDSIKERAREQEQKNGFGEEKIFLLEGKNNPKACLTGTSTSIFFD